MAHRLGYFHEDVFQRAFATAEIARMTNQEYLQYEANLKIHRDAFTTMETAITDARTQGETQKAIDIACEMKRDGIDSKVIAKYTGLSLEEIDRLV